MSKVKPALNIIDKIYQSYHEDAGKMLVHTGVIGWVMSSMAQITAIVMNDKIPKEQKMFLVPQEFADACVNILSFYLITQTFSSVGAKLARTGKWIPSDVKKFLIKNNFTDKIGKLDFNIGRDVELKGTAKRSYNLFNIGLGLSASTIGSVISCNIITPLVRNLYASHRQQTNIAKLNNPNPSHKDSNIYSKKYVPLRTNLQTFMSSGSLKV